MNLDHNFIQVSKLSEDQKKRSSPNLNNFFPRIQVKTSAQIQTRVKLLGGDADVDHTQIIGGDTVKSLGGICPPGFGTLVSNQISQISLIYL